MNIDALVFVTITTSQALSQALSLSLMSLVIVIVIVVRPFHAYKIVEIKFTNSTELTLHALNTKSVELSEKNSTIL